MTYLVLWRHTHGPVHVDEFRCKRDAKVRRDKLRKHLRDGPDPFGEIDYAYIVKEEA